MGHRVVSVEAQHGFRGPFGDHTVDSLRPVGRHMGQLTGAVGAQIVEEDRRRGLGQGLVQCSSSRPTRPYPCCAHAVPVRIFPSCSSRHAHILIMSRPPRGRTSVLVAPEVQRFDDATPASGERILAKSTAANPNGGRERHHGCAVPPSSVAPHSPSLYRVHAVPASSLPGTAAEACGASPQSGGASYLRGLGTLTG